jgi:hypothetical protein
VSGARKQQLSDGTDWINRLNQTHQRQSEAMTKAMLERMVKDSAKESQKHR